ncbi:MAG: hypothetical protein EBU90_10190 [Proteobacteria bacterium]|nr:hypothetical protein [Pseudomonadota bacterium]
MIKFKELREACWKGYKRVPGTKAYAKGSCVKEDGGAGGAVSAGPTVTTGPQSATDPVSATAVHMNKKKKYPTLNRKPPKM